MKPVAETPNLQELRGVPAGGVIKAKVSFAEEENFVSDGVDLQTTETRLSIFAYTGLATDPKFYISFELEQQSGMRDVTIDEKVNKVYIHKYGATYGGYAKSGIIRNLVTTSTSAKADSFSFEGVDWAERKFSATGEAFDISMIAPA